MGDKVLKCILAVLLMAAATLAIAGADMIAVLPNKLGGVIAIYKEACTTKQGGRGLQTLAFDSDNEIISTGCAGMINKDQIFVQWSNGRTFMYPVDHFQWRKVQ